FAGGGSALTPGRPTSSGTALTGSDAFLANFGAGIILDNTSVANSNRLPDPFSAVVTGGNSATNSGVRLQGGTFTLRGNATTAVNEVTNQFDIFTGTVTLENNGRNVTMTSGRVIRVASQSIGLVRGNGL